VVALLRRKRIFQTIARPLLFSLIVPPLITRPLAFIIPLTIHTIMSTITAIVIKHVNGHP
jgi:hypothetical protein